MKTLKKILFGVMMIHPKCILNIYNEYCQYILMEDVVI